jgi:hypothetical protein
MRQAAGRDDLTIASVAKEWFKEHSAGVHGDDVERRLERLLRCKTRRTQIAPGKLLEVQRRLREEGLTPNLPALRVVLKVEQYFKDIIAKRLRKRGIHPAAPTSTVGRKGGRR